MYNVVLKFSLRGQMFLLFSVMLFSVLTCDAMEKGKEQESKLWITKQRSLQIAQDIKNCSSDALAKKYFGIEKNYLKGSIVRNVLELHVFGVIGLDSNTDSSTIFINRAAPNQVEISDSKSLLNFVDKCTDILCTRDKLPRDKIFPQEYPLTIPKALCVLSNIRRVVINKAEKIDPGILELPKLTELLITFSPQAISSVMGNLDTCTGLEKLDLTSNALETVPAKISKLQNLKHLNLNMNFIKELPIALASIANLKLTIGHDSRGEMLNSYTIEEWKQKKPELFPIRYYD